VTELDVAREAAQAAGRILATYADKRPVHVDSKGAVINLVTEVDRACEDAIRAVLAQHTPDIPILGEEGGGQRLAGPLWVVDPLDGTTNFVHGFPFYSTSIALQIDGCSVAGVVLDPIRGHEYAASRGHGATRNGVPMRVSTITTLERALACTGFPYDVATHASRYLAPWKAVIERTGGIRRTGSAALDLSFTAAGALDVFWELHLALWDVAAGTLFVEEAGGIVTAVDGGPLDPADPCPLATNGHLHEPMLALLASSR
jgi:myo-inositol-1(or 4)-monophosphatase